MHRVYTDLPQRELETAFDQIRLENYPISTDEGQTNTPDQSLQAENPYENIGQLQACIKLENYRVFMFLFQNKTSNKFQMF